MDHIACVTSKMVFLFGTFFCALPFSYNLLEYLYNDMIRTRSIIPPLLHFYVYRHKRNLCKICCNIVCIETHKKCTTRNCNDATVAHMKIASSTEILNLQVRRHRRRATALHSDDLCAQAQTSNL